MFEVFGFDLGPVLTEIGSNPFVAFWYILKNGGFIALYPVLVYFLFIYWKFYVWVTYMSGIDYTLLAIDVPKDNEQSLKAVEQVFSSISGPHQNFSFKEIWWDGEQQPKYSLEIAGLGGYTQFYIQCEARLRDTVEAAIYAQYPDAEITEVEDYMQQFPKKFPNDDWVMWGVEMVFAAPSDVYPIRTYKMFEHTLTQIFADPMAAVMEIMSKLQPGENLLFQFVITPVDHHWGEKAKGEVAKIVGAKIKEKQRLVDSMSDAPVKILQMANDFIFSEEYESYEKSDTGPPNLMLYLTPGEQAILTAVQEKVGKIGYHTKFRWMYCSDIKYKGHRKAINGGCFGAIKQYNTLDMGGFRPGKKTVTRAEYLFKDQIKAYRQRKLMHNFRARENDAGEKGFMLNIEELATVWHFPTIGVMSPGIKQVEAKKAGAPRLLPLEVKSRPEEVEEVVLGPQADMKKAVAPPTLPMQTPVIIPEQTSEADNQGAPPSNLPIG